MIKGTVKNEDRLDRPWIHWRGDTGCPLPNGVNIDVVTRDGNITSGFTPLRLTAHWKYKDEGNECSMDIIRYRVNEDVCITNGILKIKKDDENKTVSTPSAQDLLRLAAGHMDDRAVTYDTPGGERSMGKTIGAFNIITGHKLKESEGWLLYQLLKDVRQWSNPDYHADSAEDSVAYSALKGEALAKGL